MLWCKWCKKYVRSISHFPKYHVLNHGEKKARRRGVNKSNPYVIRGRRGRKRVSKYPPKVHAFARKLEKHVDGIENPYALARWMYDQGYDI